MIAAFAAAASPAAVRAGSLPADTTALVSGLPDFTTLLQSPVSDSRIGAQAATRDGGLIAFTSSSDGLLAGDDDNVENVYVKNVASGAVMVVSVAADGSPSHADCQDPAISDDGTHVAFDCFGSLVRADPGAHEQVYVRDLVNHTTTLVSRASGAAGAIGDADSSDPSIDANGTHVAFVSDASNLGDGAPATQHADRVYRRTIGNGDATVLVSRATGAAGTVPSEDSDEPSIDNSGNRVAFASRGRLDPIADPNSNDNDDIYVRTIDTSTTDLVSRASGSAAGVANGAIGNQESFSPAISGNGLFVAFESHSTNLDPTQVAITFFEVFRRSLADHTTRLVSTRADGTEAHGDADAPRIDDSGTVVSFISDADNLDPAVKTATEEVYVRTLSATAPSLIIASRADGTAGAISQSPFLDTAGDLSGDGTKVAMSAAGLTPDSDPLFGAVIVRDLRGGTTRTVSRPSGAAPLLDAGSFNDGGSVSADGRYVAFATSSQGLLHGVPDGVVVRDMVTGGLTLVSREDGPNDAPLPGDSIDEPQISADGRRVAFAFAPDGERGPAEIYVRDIPTGRTYIASRADGTGGAISAGRGTEFHSLQISDDGSRVAWVTDAGNKDFSPDDPSGDFDVYVRDINAGKTFLASRPNGVLTGPGKGNAGVGENIALSGDGRRVAFSTTATNLGDGDDERHRGRPRAHDRHRRHAASQRHSRRDPRRRPVIRPGAQPRRHHRRVRLKGLDVRRDDPGDPALRAQPAREHADRRQPGRRTQRAAGRAARRLHRTAAADQRRRHNDHVRGRRLDPGCLRRPGRRLRPPIRPQPRHRLHAPDLASHRRRRAVCGPWAVRSRRITADGGCITFAAPATIADSAASTDFPQVYMRVLKPDCGRPPMPGTLTGGIGHPPTHPRDRTAPS